MSTEAFIEGVINRLKGDNTKALEELYDLYSGALFGHILNIVKKEHLAEEVLQDTFLKIWKYRDRYDPKVSRIFTWMYRIARNSALNTIDLKREKSQSMIQTIDSAVYKKIDHSSEVKPDTIGLSSLVADLEDKYREVIEMIYLNGYTQQETSEALGIPLGTIKSRVKKALQLLRSFFEEHDSNLHLILLFGYIVEKWI